MLSLVRLFTSSCFVWKVSRLTDRLPLALPYLTQCALWSHLFQSCFLPGDVEVGSFPIAALHCQVSVTGSFPEWIELHLSSPSSSTSGTHLPHLPSTRSPSNLPNLPNLPNRSISVPSLLIRVVVDSRAQLSVSLERSFSSSQLSSTGSSSSNLISNLTPILSDEKATAILRRACSLPILCAVLLSREAKTNDSSK